MLAVFEVQKTPLTSQQVGYQTNPSCADDMLSHTTLQCQDDQVCHAVETGRIMCLPMSTRPLPGLPVAHNTIIFLLPWLPVVAK